MKLKKILLIRSSHYADDDRLVKAGSFFDRLTITNLAEMGLPLLASYTPPHIEVEMIDDCLDETPFDTDADVVGISAMVHHIERAKDLAHAFKQRGKTVVMGGYLPTQHPELVQDHVDSLCIGEADAIWPQMIRDIEDGCLKERYEADFTLSLDAIPTPRYDLIRRNRIFSPNTSLPVQATRGCPNGCDYCSIIRFYKNSYRQRPVDDIIRDIEAAGSRFMYFVDDNLFDNRELVYELLPRLADLDIIWGVQSTVRVAQDQKLLGLAYDAGCRVVMVGMESVFQPNLDSVSKRWAKTSQYGEAIRAIQDAGIAAHALIMFGMPEDKPDVFDRSVDFLEEYAAASAEFFIVTPYPVTPLGRRFLEQGLIVDDDLSHYREPYCVFKHPHMTPEEIQQGYWRAFRRFFSLRSIFKRLLKANRRHLPYQLLNNMTYWMKLKRKIVPTQFQRGNY